MAKVLLVEDDELTPDMDMLSRRRGELGYDVTIAIDGAEAVEGDRSEAPDHILIDGIVPVTGGWDATRQIRDDMATRRMPVIAMIAHAVEGDRKQALEAGCPEFAPKPIALPRWLRKIEAVLAAAGT